MRTQHPKTLRSLFLILLAFLTVGVAFAQTTQPMSTQDILGATPQTDLSRLLWRSIFGKFADDPWAISVSSMSLLGNMFVLFNTLVFSVGVAWISYGVFSGVVGTAQEGESLGRRIDTAWYPIRVITGISGMIPIFGGFSGSQALIMWVCSLGIGMANMLWNSAIDNPGNPLMNIGVPNALTATPLDDLAESMIKSDVCMILLNNEIASVAAVSGVSLPVTDMPNANWDSSKNILHYGTAVVPDLCGNVRLTQEIRQSKSLFGFRAGAVNYQAIGAPIMEAYKQAFSDFHNDLFAIASDWVNDRNASMAAAGGHSKPIDYALVRVAEIKFKKTIMTALDAIYASNKDGISSNAKANMHAYGWMSAGGWFATFAEVSTAFNEAVNSVKLDSAKPAFQYIQYSNVRNRLDALHDAFSAGKVSDGQSNGGSESVDSDARQAVKDFGCWDWANKYAGTQTGDCSLGQGVVEAAIRSTATQGSGVTIAGLPLVNPILMFKNIGDYVTTFSSGIIAVNAMYGDKIDKAGKAADVVGGIPGASWVTGFVSGFAKLWKALSGLAWILLVAGLVMSLYIPLIPFIVWMGACLGYAASFLEGLVAMPLHSFSHLDSEGEGMGQKTGFGYLFLLNTLMRPSVMMIAFFIASVLVVIMGTFQAALFLPAMQNMMGNSFTGIASVIGLLLIFLVINVTLINACFHLIHVIPDQVIGFVGAANISAHLGHDAESKINNLFLGAARGGQQGVAAVVGRGGGSRGQENGSAGDEPPNTRRPRS